MDSEELLAQLADIHLPGDVSWWPPAVGWWVLALLLIAATVFLARKLLQLRRERLILNHALAELHRVYEEFADSDDSDAAVDYLNQFNAVLRRVALVHFPDHRVASLGGREWVDFIKEKGDPSLVNEDIEAALSYGRFQPQYQVDVEALDRMGRNWITSLYTTPSQQQATSAAETT